MCKKYATCGYCRKQVNISRFLFPGWHVCAYTEADARAKMLIHLIENNLLKL
jgi:hypothetical protein